MSGPLRGARATSYQGSFYGARAWLINAILRQAAYWIAQDQEGHAAAPSAVEVLVDAAIVIACCEDGEIEVTGTPYRFVLAAVPAQTTVR